MSIRPLFMSHRFRYLAWMIAVGALFASQPGSNAFAQSFKLKTNQLQLPSRNINQKVRTKSNQKETKKTTPRKIKIKSGGNYKKPKSLIRRKSISLPGTNKPSTKFGSSPNKNSSSNGKSSKNKRIKTNSFSTFRERIPVDSIKGIPKSPKFRRRNDKAPSVINVPSIRPEIFRPRILVPTVRPDVLRPEMVEPSTPDVSPSGENSTPLEESMPQSLALLKPTLACRSVRNRNNVLLARGFKVRLYSKSDIDSHAAKLSNTLDKYQRSGGGLSRCAFMGFVGPKSYKTYFGSEKPRSATRVKDGYTLNIFDRYQDLLRNSNGYKSRFGIYATTISLGQGNSSRKILRLTFNNALVLFLDSKNRGLYQFGESDLPVRPIYLSDKISQIIGKHAKIDLQKIVEFKRRFKLRSKSHFFPFDSTLMGHSYFPRLAIKQVPDIQNLSASGFYLASIIPSKYCTINSDVFGTICNEVTTRNMSMSSQCKEAFEGKRRELGLCELMFGEINEIQGTSDDNPVQHDSHLNPEDEFADLDQLDADVNSVDSVSDFDFSCDDNDEFCTEEFSNIDADVAAGSNDNNLGSYDELELNGSEIDDNFLTLDEEAEFLDTQVMLPEGMEAPTSVDADQCESTKISDKLLCVFLSALTSMLEEAFASN